MNTLGYVHYQSDGDAFFGDLAIDDTPQICILRTLGGQPLAPPWVILRDGIEIGYGRPKPGQPWFAAMVLILLFPGEPCRVVQARLQPVEDDYYDFAMVEEDLKAWLV